MNQDDELRKDEDTPVADQAGDGQEEQEDLVGGEPMDIDKSLEGVGLSHDEDDESRELNPDTPK